jgi:hypothetical protein
VTKGSSSLNLRGKRTILNRIFNLARINITHMLGTPKGRSEATVCLSFRLVDQSHHKRLQDHTHYQSAGHTSVARLQNPYSWLPLQHVFPHVESSNQKNQIHVVGGMSTPRADWLLGLPLTQNSRHVVSTFKRLTPITTHCHLIKIQQHRWGIISTMILHKTPVRHPYSDCRNVNITTPISRE